VSEQSPAASRRATLLVAVVAAVVLVVVAVVILRSAGPDDSPESHPPTSPSKVLAHSSSVVDEAVASFRDRHHETWPANVWTEDSDLKMTGPGASEVYSPGVDKGVRVTWYRSQGDRFAYCLTGNLHRLVVITSSTEVMKRTATGACPAPSLKPELDPES
jgi:hypothetical protein